MPRPVGVPTDASGVEQTTEDHQRACAESRGQPVELVLGQVIHHFGWEQRGWDEQLRRDLAAPSLYVRSGPRVGIRVVQTGPPEPDVREFVREVKICAAFVSAPFTNTTGA